MEGASTSATANTELQDLAALLWASNEKGDIHLPPSEAGALASYLGLERIRQEVSQDAEYDCALRRASPHCSLTYVPGSRRTCR